MSCTTRIALMLIAVGALAMSAQAHSQIAVSPTVGPWYMSLGGDACGVAQNYPDAAATVVSKLNAGMVADLQYRLGECLDYASSITGLLAPYKETLYNEAPCLAEMGSIEAPNPPESAPFCTVMLNSGDQVVSGPLFLRPERHFECPPGYIHNYATNPMRHFCMARMDDVCRVGDPVSPLSGMAFEEEVDYRSGDANSLEFKRYYNGGRFYAPGYVEIGKRIGGFTNLWGHTYGGRVHVEQLNMGVSITVVRPDGELWLFDDTGKEIYNHGGRGGSARIARLADNSWRLTLANSDVETYSASGDLTSITTRSGFVTTISRSQGQLRVTDGFGRTLTLALDGSGRIESLTDPAGSVTTYGYSGSQLSGTELLVSVTYPDLKSRKYTYARAGGWQRLSKITDESNHTFAAFYYYTEGRVKSSERAGGAEQFTFRYTAGYALNQEPATTIVDPMGRSRTLRMTSAGGVYRMTSISGGVCDACGNVAGRAYDESGNVTTSRDFNGVRTTYGYDLTRNLETRRTEAVGTPLARTIRTTWHPVYRLPLSITEPGRITSFTYDAVGNVLTRTVADTSITPSVSRRWTYTYNDIGQMLSEDGPRTDVSDKTTYAYYSCSTGFSCGQLQSVTNALGQTTTFESYNAHGQPLSIKDANGVITTLAYDERRRLTSQRVAGESTRYAYWPTGLLRKVTLPDGSYVEYTYDKAQRLTQVADGAGNRVAYVLDAMGNRTSESAYDPANVLAWMRTQVFNSLNQLSQQVGAAGTAAVTTSFTYDGNGNQTGISAPFGRTVSRQFDELNRLKELTDPGAGNTRFEYDARSNVTSVTDPRNLVTSYSYNGFDNLLSQASPDSGITAQTYDDAGNVESRTDARGVRGTFKYDALNRVISATYPDQTLAFTYDSGTNGLGQLTRASDASQTLSWSYDRRGRVTRKTQKIGSVSRVVSYAYTAGRLTSLVTPSGQTIQYGYAQGHIDSIAVNGASLLSSVLYLPFGPAREWKWGSGTATVRKYDTDMMLTRIESGGEFLNLYYDNASRLTGVDNPLDSTGSWAYFRDSRDRLTGANGPDHILSFGYDANGNRQSHADFGTPSFNTALTLSGTSNRLMDISGSRSNVYAYDAGGHVLSETNPARLLSVAGTTTAHYVYNALSQRVSKTVGSVTTYFVYDELGHLLGEYAGTGALIQETVWMEDIPVATLRPRADGGVDTYYIHTDHLNAPRTITRSADNAVMWRWVASPFGSNLPEENPQNAGTFTYNLRFPGQYYDAESGLHYNYFRNYDPATGRYLEPDPIGLGGGINPYIYAAADPATYVDPMGLIICDGRWRRMGELVPSLLTTGWMMITSAACECYWLCTSCNGQDMWSGNIYSLPRTRGATVVIFGSGMNPGSGGIRPLPPSRNDMLRMRPDGLTAGRIGPRPGAGPSATSGGATRCVCSRPGPEIGCTMCYPNSRYPDGPA